MRSYEIHAGLGFYYHEPTGTFIEFSDNIYRWGHYPISRSVVVPPLDHPSHKSTLRHELTHVYDYHFFKRTNWLLFAWIFLTSVFLFEGWYELYVNIRARDLRGVYLTRYGIGRTSQLFVPLVYLVFFSYFSTKYSWNQAFSISLFSLCFLGLIIYHDYAQYILRNNCPQIGV